MSEFNLSKKILSEGNNTWGMKEGWLDVEDVKEFIKRLKETIEEEMWDWDCFRDKESFELRNTIDKLAGNKLTGEENEN